MSWLGLEDRTVVVAGVANRKSVAFHVGRALADAGANVVWTVRTEERRDELRPRLGDDPIHVCDVTRQEQIDALGAALDGPVHGLVHCIARAEYAEGPTPFHETRREDFLRAVDVSAYSLVALANALRPRLADDASVVALSISTTTMAAENYGYMAPVKAALDSAVVFLAKSFAASPAVRFNAVRAGLLKTSSSAGIPGYLESWLYAEEATLRKRGLETREVADAVLYLLSPRSSGSNATSLVVDAGMATNYFDREIVERVTRPEET